MAQINLNIIQPELGRLLAVLPEMGYTYNPELVDTDAQQKEKFVKAILVDELKKKVIYYERILARKAALEGLSDFDSSNIT